MQRNVLITGASGGLGRATVRAFAATGWTVFAASREPPTLSERVVPIVLDVTDEASCSEAIREVGTRCTGLGAVVNLAGVFEVGILVAISDETMVRPIAVNLLGTFRVNKAAFPLVVSGGGRIVNVSSETGRIPGMPVTAPYTVSKHAVEVYSEALRRELRPLGIPVIVIRPGTFKTDMTTSFSRSFDVARAAAPAFGSQIEGVARRAESAEAGAADPAILADAIVRAVVAPRPRRTYVVRGAWQMRVLRLVPPSVLDRL